MIALTLAQPYPWCIERGLLAVLPIGKSIGDPLAREWRTRIEKRRIAIRSSAGLVDHAFVKAMKGRMLAADFDALWKAVLDMPLGAVVGTALAGSPFIGDDVNSRAALVGVERGTVCVTLTEFEALAAPVFSSGPDEHLAVYDWDMSGKCTLHAPTTEHQGRLF